MNGDVIDAAKYSTVIAGLIGGEVKV